MPTNSTRTSGRMRSLSGGSTLDIISPMAQWLVKEEPDHYGYDQLERDRKTVWAGVRNPLAQKHLRGIRKGDSIFYYHTGKEKSVIAVAKALTRVPSVLRASTSRRPIRCGWAPSHAKCGCTLPTCWRSHATKPRRPALSTSNRSTLP